MYVIKAIPEDFTVREVGSLQPGGKGPYAYFVLRKRNWSTIEALEAIAVRTGTSIADFGWAGNKDKVAITEQICSAKGVSREQLERISIPGITITYLGQSGRPVALGTHEGNEFTITVRNLEHVPEWQAQFINLYGGQRFSTHNVAIGRALIKKKYDVVIEHLSHDPQRSPVLAEALAKHPRDTLGALKHLPHSLLTLFVHAYQSELWNALALALGERAAPQQELPMLGFGTTDADIKNFPLLQEQLKAEAITPRDFVLRSFPSLSAEGGVRPLYAIADNIRVIGIDEDEMYPGTKKVTLEFSLQKGSYATEFIRQNIR